MLTRYFKYLLYPALLVCVSTGAFLPLPAAADELLLFFRESGVVTTLLPSPQIPKALISLNQNGDLQIQHGRTSFIVAYSSPVDRFKPAEQLPVVAWDHHPAAINGISLTACVTF